MTDEQPTVWVSSTPLLINNVDTFRRRKLKLAAINAWVNFYIAKFNRGHLAQRVIKYHHNGFATIEAHR